MLDISPARSDADFDAVRALCWAYRDFLLGLGGRDAEAVLHYYGEATYAALMDDLPRYHAPPDGEVLLARLDGAPVGCGMVHTFAPGMAQIKRVYLTEAARGQGGGRAMMEALIALCRVRGFERILMDTGARLETAVALYDRLGFKRRGPYQEIPEDLLDLLVFFEMEL